MNKFVEQKWNMVGKPTVLLHDTDGYFIAKFNTLDDRNAVLYSGPCYVGKEPIIMKPWTPDFRFQKDQFFRVIPLWVQLPNLPLNCWGTDSLSRIGSAIGKPLLVDECTSKQLKIAYARVLIDTDLTKRLPETVTIEDPSGKTFVQKVVFEWKPLNFPTFVALNQQKRIGVTRKTMIALGPGADENAIDKTQVLRIDAGGSNTKDTDVSKKTVRLVTKRVPVSKLIHGKLSPEELQKFIAIESEMALQDRIMEETTERKKALESYVLDMKHKFNDKYGEFVSPSEKDKFIASLQHVEDWLDLDGEDETKNIYILKLQELKKVGDMIDERYKADKEQKAAVHQLNCCLDTSRCAVMSNDHRFDHISPYEKYKALNVCAEVETWLKQKKQQQDAYDSCTNDS